MSQIADGRVVRMSDITPDASSYVDPQGFLFHLDGEIFRCIRPRAVPLFRDLFQDGTVARLVQECGLVSTTPVNLMIEEEPEALVVHHKRVRVVSHCVEWCPSMLHDAGRLTLELAVDLADRDLMLQDAYPWNVLYDGWEPVFVDLTSIAPADPVVLWPAHEQFEEYFIRPLTLSREGKGRAARALLMNNINGIGLDEFARLISARYRLLHPSLAVARWLNNRLQRSRALRDYSQKMAQRATARATPAVRRRFLQRLLRRLSATGTRELGDPWVHYYAEIGPDVDKRAKIEAVGRSLDRLRPDSVLDLGCNTGVFSLEAARHGIRVVALDKSETCIERLYATACQARLSITPLVSDALCPTPAYGFMGCQYPDLWTRVRSELVLCLGLMHHLHISGRQSLERVADLLAAVTTRYLIFEFVGRDDANIPYLSQRRPIDYTLETVVSALSRRFPHIEAASSDRPTRKLLLCTK